MGEIPGVVSGGNVRRGMKYPEGNVPDPSWADEQDKMLIMPSNLLNAKKLSPILVGISLASNKKAPE